jgi:MFS family permease
MTALAHGFWAMLAARMLVGASVAGAAPAALSLVADLVPAQQRGKTFALLVLGQVAGQSVTFAAVGGLLAHADALQPLSPIGGLAPWRVSQLVFAAGLFAVAGLLLALREMWSMRRLLVPMMVGLTAILMADTASAIWAVPVLTRFLHQQPTDFGNWMGIVFLVSGLGGAIAGGWIADAGQRRHGRAGVLAGAAHACAVSVPAALFPLANDVALFGFLFALIVFAGAAVGVIASAAISVLFPNELRGLCVTLVTAVGTLVSFGVAPSLVTALATGSGSGDDIRIPLAVVGVAASVLGTLAFRRARA